MAKARKKPTGQISLFPFLSILAAAIGTLAFIITGFSTMRLSRTEQIIEPSLTGSDKTPRFVECREEGLLIHPGRIPVVCDEIGMEGNAWDRLLSELEARADDECLVLMVRDEGFTAFEEAYSEAKSRGGIEFGYDPVYTAGPIKVQALEKEERR